MQEHRNVYTDLLDKDTPTLAALATKFVLSMPGASSVLVGIDRRQYLDDVLAICESPPLPPNIRNQIIERRYPDPQFLDLPQWDRLGWLT